MTNPDKVIHLRGILEIQEEITKIHAIRMKREMSVGSSAAETIEACQITWLQSRMNVHMAAIDVIEAEST
jgi:hypothetical protein